MRKGEANVFARYAHKLCRDLRHRVAECQQPISCFPYLLNKWVGRVKKYFTKVDVIIQTAAYRSSEENEVDPVLKKAQKQAKEDLAIVEGFAAKMSLALLERLLVNSHVKKIWLDRQVYAVNDIVRATVGSGLLWSRKITGKGVGVAVIDTGVYPHRDLTSKCNRIVAFKDFVNKKTKPYDDNGHGTHVAGTIAGNGNASGGRYAGIAPEANIIAVKVLDRKGSGWLSKVILGVQWCIQNRNRYGIRVINLSVGSEAVVGHQKDLVCQAVRKAWDAGICVCVAAGNEGPDPRTISSPGIEPKVITVGASDDNRTSTSKDDTIADFSSRGPTIDNLLKPDIVAPGCEIRSLRSPGSLLDRQLKSSSKSAYLNLSGTSMATPVVAGIAALLYSKYPSLTPYRIKQLLMQSAQAVIDDPLKEGKGLVNIKKITQLLKLRDEPRTD